MRWGWGSINALLLKVPKILPDNPKNDQSHSRLYVPPQTPLNTHHGYRCQLCNSIFHILTEITTYICTQSPAQAQSQSHPYPHPFHITSTATATSTNYTLALQWDFFTICMDAPWDCIAPHFKATSPCTQAIHAHLIIDPSHITHTSTHVQHTHKHLQLNTTNSTYNQKTANNPIPPT